MNTYWKRALQIRDMSRPFIKVFAYTSSLLLAMQILAMASAYLWGRIVDAATGEVSVIVWLIGAMTAIFVASNLLEWMLSRVQIGRILTDMELHFNRITMDRISKLSIGQLTNQNSGYKQDVIKKGESAIAEMVNTLFNDAIPNIARLLIACLAMFFINGLVGAVASICVVCYVATSIMINRFTVPKVKQIRRLENKLGTRYWENIKHLRLVTVSNQERRMVDEYSNDFAGYSDAFKAVWNRYVALVTFVRQPFALAGQIGCLALSLYLLRIGEMTVGDMVIVFGWSSMAFWAIAAIGSMQRRIVRNYVMIAKYFDMLEIPPAVTVIENPIRPEKFEGRIELRNVSFAYPKTFKGDEEDEDQDAKSPDESQQALKDVSITIEPGKVSAFVGHSGSGKSTVINLILRGYDPTAGQVLVDGHDLRLLDLGHWRRSIGIVEQDPKLWDQTLRYNILYGLNGEGGHVTDEQLHEIARKTRIDEFYGRLEPKGFDTEIGENGVQLSGGQRQRVAIARAIIKSPSLLILDEATNALDPMNEQLVHEAIREALAGRTGIIIAHRLSTIRNADRIFVFEKGTVVGAGTHKELMAGCKAYQELVMREVGTLDV